MQVTILSVSIEHMPGKNGGYDKAEVAFKGDDGKVSGKNLVSFNAPEAFAVVKAASNGDILDVTTEKDAKGYWQWVKVVKVDAAQAAAQQAVASTTKTTSATTTPRNTYETPEERVQKQIYIVRQSAINAAIATLASPDGIVVEDVLQLAREYEKFVYRKDEVKSEGFTDFKDDSDQVI